jgi:hypothetical protein
MSTPRNKVAVSNSLNFPFCNCGNPLHSTDMGIAGFKCCFTALELTLFRERNLLRRMAAEIKKNPVMITERFLLLPAACRQMPDPSSLHKD